MAWQEFPLLGFCPDLPVTTPGVIGGSGLVATDRGIGDQPAFQEQATAALNGASIGGALLSNTSATQEMIVGTTTKLYGYDLATTVTDRSGGAYNATATNSWSVTQFGNIALAANLGDQLQQRTIAAGANFASVGAAPVPKASIVLTAGPTSAPFVVVFDYADGVNTDRDGWKCSAISDYTGWTAGTNQCATGRLLDNVPGPITAAIPYRDGIVAWKRTGMYVGSYSGFPYIWSWQRISSDVGCIGKNACVEADDVIYWADDRGLWMYDGSYPRQIPGHVNSWWSTQLGTNISTAADRNGVKVIWDKLKHVLWFIQSATVGGTSFNLVSQLWAPGGGVFSTTTPSSASMTELVSARYGVDSNNKMAKLVFGVGAPTAPATFTSWIFSDWTNAITIRGIRPHLSNGPSGASNWLSGTLGFDYTSGIEWGQQALYLYPGYTGNSVNLVQRNPGKLDGLASANSLQFSISSTKNFEITGFSVDIQSAGKNG